MGGIPGNPSSTTLQIFFGIRNPATFSGTVLQSSVLFRLAVNDLLGRFRPGKEVNEVFGVFVFRRCSPFNPPKVRDLSCGI